MDFIKLKKHCWLFIVEYCGLFERRYRIYNPDDRYVVMTPDGHIIGVAYDIVNAQFLARAYHYEHRGR